MTKVISGVAKGINLKVFPQRNLRPTSCRAKEALFDIIQFKINNKIFIDMFSGTGQVGIEALSRGAKKVIFVENSNESIKILKENLKLVSNYCKYNFNHEIFRCDYLEFLKKFKYQADILFADAPFNMRITDKIFEKFTNAVKDDGMIITETSSKNEQLHECLDFNLLRRYTYGRISLNFYVKRNRELVDNGI